LVFSAFRKLRHGLGKTRDRLVGRLGAALKREVFLSDDFLEEVEEILIAADVGVDAAVELSEGLGRRLREAGAEASLEQVTGVLREEITTMLGGAEGAELSLGGPPHVILVVGVNGVGKTTSIAKLARWHQSQGRKVLLGAGDTFRAAAVEQLSLWAERIGVDIVKQDMGADPAAVAFDTLAHARAQDHDVVIIDTAGRLQNKEGLMRELEKIGRVVRKQIDAPPHETLLCLDANTGQNGMSQAREFTATVPLDAIFLTKLDGTAKGGIVVAIAQGLDLPVRYIGTGESADDFAHFHAAEFAGALFDQDEEGTRQESS
jgi:fused signal recognition particle receptor